jgi:hypothetical protein
MWRLDSRVVLFSFLSPFVHSENFSTHAYKLTKKKIKYLPTLESDSVLQSFLPRQKGVTIFEPMYLFIRICKLSQRWYAFYIKKKMFCWGCWNERFLERGEG